MRVLVCGGRDYADAEAVGRALSRLHAERGIACVVHGDARGADTLAKNWALVMDIPQESYPPNWSLGRKAGPLRNQRMLEHAKPDGVVAFPGGSGTADMCRRAEAAGLKVWRPQG